jgi:hypothetical protein
VICQAPICCRGRADHLRHQVLQTLAVMEVRIAVEKLVFAALEWNLLHLLNVDRRRPFASLLDNWVRTALNALAGSAE